ncbi:MAG: flagellar basal body-associated FliL family protein [Oscillospiraceae bacterium]|nr:flagellar basal body-associated FliL family protein [Oscillospiraceae bacterium]MCL2279307.1 flagellar basal body-associated FliL family protein [Oscillospiraceae bacterium]
MIKAILKKMTPLVCAILAGMFLLVACDSEPPRVPPVHVFNPGMPFSTNFNHDDPRRQISCSIIFEVIDESAGLELEELNFIVRNAVLAVLGELTMDELTIDRNLDDIAERIVTRVNEDLGLPINLIVRAYFTAFAIV